MTAHSRGAPSRPRVTASVQRRSRHTSQQYQGKQARADRGADQTTVWPTGYVMTHWPLLTGYLPASPTTVLASAIAEAVLAYAPAGRRPTRGRRGPKRARSLASRFSAMVRSAHGAVYRCAHLAVAVWGYAHEREVNSSQSSPGICRAAHRNGIG